MRVVSHLIKAPRARERGKIAAQAFPPTSRALCGYEFSRFRSWVSVLIEHRLSGCTDSAKTQYPGRNERKKVARRNARRGNDAAYRLVRDTISCFVVAAVSHYQFPRRAAHFHSRAFRDRFVVRVVYTRRIIITDKKREKSRRAKKITRYERESRVALCTS